MASASIIAWQIEGKKVVETYSLFWGSKITADCDCTHETWRWLLLGNERVKLSKALFNETQNILMVNEQQVQVRRKLEWD